MMMFVPTMILLFPTPAHLPPVRVVPLPVVRPARPAPLLRAPKGMSVPAEPDAVYHRRLVARLCEVKPVFCDWLVR